MAVLGQDLAPIRDSVSGALAALRGATDAADQASPSFASVLRAVSQPQSGLDAGLAPLYQVGYGAQAGGGFGGNAWQTLANAASAFGAGGGLNLDLSQAWQSIGSFGNYQAARAAAAVPDTRGTPQPGPKPAPAPGTGGAGWTGPATADDNKSITADKVEQVIANTRSNSPMRGKGQLILDYANQQGVSVPLIMGIFLAESELGTTAGPGWNVAGVGGAGHFAGYSSIDDAIRGAIDNLATDTYRGKSLENQVGNWFVGPQGWAQNGLNASDGANGTVGQYISGKVAPMYDAFGVPIQQAQAPTRATDMGKGAGGMASIWGGGLTAVTGGTAYPIMQEFGDTDYSNTHPDTYAYAGAYGAHGHTGIDWNAPLGTQVYTPVGGTVSIVGFEPGQGYHFTNTMTQSDPNTSGEFAITLDNGDILILGHLQSIGARVGQRLDPGTLIGLSGGSDGAHVHIEYRQKNADGSYTIVDPRTKLGG